MDIRYLQIIKPYSFASPFKGEGFVALIYAADKNTSAGERETLSDQIVAAGCRYAICAGHDCESWHDSIDMADLRRNTGEIRDDNLVMTTSHDNECLEDIVFFLLFNTSFDNFTAERFVVLLVGGDGSQLSRIQREIEKQLAQNRP